MIKSMLLILLLIFGLVIIIFIILNVLRKWYWDGIQSNLLDLVDDIGGQVIRHGFFSRPFYHGNYQQIDLTINFSSERLKKGRSNLIDISLATSLKESLTISSFQWLKDIEEKSIGDYEPLSIKGEPLYGLRKSDSARQNARIFKSDFIHHLEKLHPFRFIFIGQQGVLYEIETENLPQSTRHPRLKEQLDGIFELISGLRK